MPDVAPLRAGAVLGGSEVSTEAMTGGSGCWGARGGCKVMRGGVMWSEREEKGIPFAPLGRR